jgi:hypothetical protein
MQALKPTPPHQRSNQAHDSRCVALATIYDDDGIYRSTYRDRDHGTHRNRDRMPERPVFLCKRPVYKALDIWRSRS